MISSRRVRNARVDRLVSSVPFYWFSIEAENARARARTHTHIYCNAHSPCREKFLPRILFRNRSRNIGFVLSQPRSSSFNVGCLCQLFFATFSPSCRGRGVERYERRKGHVYTGAHAVQHSLRMQSTCTNRARLPVGFRL